MSNNKISTIMYTYNGKNEPPRVPNSQRYSPTDDQQKIPTKYFKNSIKVHIRNKKKPVARKTIFDSLFELIQENVSNITYISQFNDYSTWFISFHPNFNAKGLIGGKIVVNDEEIEILSPEKEIVKLFNISFRVQWLPHHFEINKVKTFFQRISAQTIEVKEEYCKEERMKNVRNGNFIVKLGFKTKEQVDAYGDDSQILEIDGNKCLVSRLGVPPKCLLCKSTEHLKRNCPLAKIKCSKCNKIGHKEEACSFSKIVNSCETLLNLPDEDQDKETVEFQSYLNQVTDVEEVKESEESDEGTESRLQDEKIKDLNKREREKDSVSQEIRKKKNVTQNNKSSSNEHSEDPNDDTSNLGDDIELESDKSQYDIEPTDELVKKVMDRLVHTNGGPNTSRKN